MRRAGILATAAILLASMPAGQMAAPSVSPAPVNPIDREVTRHLRAVGASLAPPSSDAVFVRRVYLDLIGTLPTAAEARAFHADPSPAKRRDLVERLLEREEFADYWAMKWSDVLRVKSEFPINLWPNAVQAYHRWIRANVRDNVSYDRFARALLTEAGSNFRVPPVNFFRAVQSREPAALAQAVALTFLGSRMERWPADRQAGFAAFFARVGFKATSEWKEEIVFFDRQRGGPPTALLPDGSSVELSPDRDPRGVFADWLLAPENPWFARAIANRIWFWLMGHGIVHEPDDLRPDNPPADAELLAILERELRAARFDLRRLFRLILTSETYQQSAPSGRDDRTAFASYLVRPLEAEVLADALCQITGTAEHYTSAIPEPFTFTPPGQRAIALADGSISSALLDTFGRSPRDTGLLLERTRLPTPAERLYLLNSSHIQTKIAQSPALQPLIAPRNDARRMVTDLYFTILSRPPADAELRTALAYAQATANRRMAGTDLAWALVNTVEFLYRH